MPSGLIICDGNSITASPGIGGVTPWPVTAAASLAYGGGMTFTNIAVGGQVTGTMLTNAPTAVDAVLTASAGPTKMVCVWELTNDIANGGSAPIHAYNRMRRYCAERKANGFKVIVATMLPRGTGTVFSDPVLETYRTSVNTLIRNNYTAFADALVDVGANATIGATGAFSNATYYQDGIHLTNAGQAIVAGLFATAIASLAT